MSNDNKNIIGDVDLSKEQLSPFEAAQIARNLDSIERYRAKNSEPLGSIESAIGLTVGIAAWGLLVSCFVWAIFFA